MSDKPVAERLQVKGNRRFAVIGASAVLDKMIDVRKARAGVADADVVLFSRRIAPVWMQACRRCSRQRRRPPSFGSPIPN